jgi:hypothetical protein
MGFLLSVQYTHTPQDDGRKSKTDFRRFMQKIGHPKGNKSWKTGGAG